MFLYLCVNFIFIDLFTIFQIVFSLCVRYNSGYLKKKYIYTILILSITDLLQVSFV